MIIRAAIFDLDGTLVDSLEDLTDAVNHLRNAYSYPPLTAESVRQKVGKGTRNLIQQVLPGISDTDMNRALCLFLDFNRAHIADKSRLYPGMQDTLQALAIRNVRLAVISNKNEELSTLILQTLGIDDLFESISGGDTFPERKPSPLPLLNVADSLGIAPADCAMVGDSINDIEAGNRADMTSIACSWGYGSREELLGADVLVHTPQELLAAISAGSR
jgi:phosphoglycolate phosphatase